MGYRSLVKGLVKTAFKLVGDLKDTVEYHHVTAGAVDPVTEVQSTTEVTDTFECVRTSLSDLEVDYFPGPLVTEKLLISWNVLSSQPKEPDYVVIAGETWQVRRSKGVPGESLWIVYIQRT